MHRTLSSDNGYWKILTDKFLLKHFLQGFSHFQSGQFSENENRKFGAFRSLLISILLCAFSASSTCCAVVSRINIIFFWICICAIRVLLWLYDYFPSRIFYLSFIRRWMLLGECNRFDFFFDTPFEVAFRLFLITYIVILMV